MTRVVILRGIPGSGKSTWTEKNLGLQDLVSSADRFMVDEKGQYDFSRDKLDDVHRKCLKRFVLGITPSSSEGPFAGPPNVVVDNTNTLFEHMKIYLDLARAFSCGIRIVRMDCPIDVARARQRHAVPIQTLERMQRNLEIPLPKEWRDIEEVVRTY